VRRRPCPPVVSPTPTPTLWAKKAKKTPCRFRRFCRRSHSNRGEIGENLPITAEIGASESAEFAEESAVQVSPMTTVISFSGNFCGSKYWQRRSFRHCQYHRNDRYFRATKMIESWPSAKSSSVQLPFTWMSRKPNFSSIRTTSYLKYQRSFASKTSSVTSSPSL